ncbi:MAG: hypothetical protein MJ142_01265 [Clostridia bacterium]|nr:hypothetical protein [Clostridia bacterium]
MTKRGKVGLGVLIAAGVISLAFIIWFITVTCVKLADARKEAERNAQEAFAAAWNPEEI